MTPQPTSIEMVEVGPRDGLQNETRVLPAASRISLIRRAIGWGVRRIEVASFVDPRRVPQMADAEAVISGIYDVKSVAGGMDGVVTIGLVLNRRGAERALATRVEQLGAVCIATDSLAQRNQGQTSAGSVAIAAEIIGEAHRAGRTGQAMIGAAFGCPYEGEVDPDRVVAIAEAIAAAGAVEVGLADTIGAATPGEVARLVARVVAAVRPLPVRVHFHNSRGAGPANVWAAIGAGAVSIDAALGGFGGCPFAPGAAGNVASEDTAYLLARSGIATGLDLDKMITAATWLAGELGRPLPAMLGRAGIFPAAAGVQAAA